MADNDSRKPVAAVGATLAIGAVALAALYWAGKSKLGLPPAAIQAAARDTPAEPANTTPGSMRLVPAGRFLRGSDKAASADARPAHAVTLAAYSIDAYEVTNREFASFVDATGYRTIAERLGYSYVFRPEHSNWQKVAGADWRHPQGPDDSLLTKPYFPVVHVCWFDAKAYARWAGKRLPSEAEWERAARGNLHDMQFPWGNEELDAGRRRANYWRSGVQPNDITGPPRIQAVGKYAPNNLGLYDFAGNVWEWCGDWYAADEYQRAASDNPHGPETGTERVARGGSWVGSSDGPIEIMVHHRGHFPPEFSASHLGFRCVQDVDTAR